MPTWVILQISPWCFCSFRKSAGRLLWGWLEAGGLFCRSVCSPCSCTGCVLLFCTGLVAVPLTYGQEKCGHLWVLYCITVETVKKVCFCNKDGIYMQFWPWNLCCVQRCVRPSLLVVIRSCLWWSSPASLFFPSLGTSSKWMKLLPLQCCTFWYPKVQWEHYAPTHLHRNKVSQPGLLDGDVKGSSHFCHSACWDYGAVTHVNVQLSEAKDCA